jgi:hypothetical protein
MRTLALFFVLLPALCGAQPPLRLAIAGLVHGHVDGFLRAAKNRSDVQIVAIFDPDTALQQKYAQRYGWRTRCSSPIWRPCWTTANPKQWPFTNTYDHPTVVESLRAAASTS